MKKIALIFALLVCSFATAQTTYDFKEAEKIVKESKAPGLVSTYKGRRVYFDYEAKQYLLDEHFKKRYGKNTLDKLDELYINSLSFADRERQDVETNLMHPIAPRNFNYSYKWKLRTENLVIGTSAIGASATAYMLSRSIISSKTKNLANRYADGKMKLDDYNDKVASLDKTNRTVGYVCAGVSLAGVVVVLMGLHKEYTDGLNIGHNIIVSDNGGGISITKKF